MAPRCWRTGFQLEQTTARQIERMRNAQKGLANLTLVTTREAKALKKPVNEPWKQRRLVIGKNGLRINTGIESMRYWEPKALEVRAALLARGCAQAYEWPGGEEDQE